MKPSVLGLGLGILAGLAVLVGEVAAWTEADMQGARRLLEGKLEQQRAAEAKAQAESEAKAAAKAKAESEAKAAAEAKAKAESEAKAAAEVAAKAEAAAQAARQRAGDSIAQGMVKIPGGDFQMGCSPGDGQGNRIKFC
ncbi:hypothetical protein [uncultured Thiodictyon sp.]|uniref:hypothetical protein n=1 Tax=uncultured Thiodictyon sp. TaxID=1846217 RepID=UPI0025FEF98E|nr:hypothetical protein [uncultured Thiodictyon sp.]